MVSFNLIVNARKSQVVGQGIAAPGQSKHSHCIQYAQSRLLNPNLLCKILIKASSFAVGNKVDLVQPSASTSEGDESTNTIVPSSGNSSEDEGEDSEADDATATPTNGNRSALTSARERQVSREEASAYAEEAGLLFFETSAKTGEGIVEVFTEIGTFLIFSISIHCSLSHNLYLQRTRYRSTTS